MQMSGMSRRRFSAMLFSAAGLPFVDWQDLNDILVPAEPDALPFSTRALSYPLFDEAVSRVLPEKGFQSKIALKDSIVRLVEHGVIDRGKFFAIYGTNGPQPGELADVLSRPSSRGIPLTGSNATSYVNLLWPVGLANQMAANADSPLNGDSLYNFASTGGWSLGREQNGGAYFNKLPIVKLTRNEEARVVRIAKSAYRPCCNNSTFFQDCNHGSALLGLLELGASQGLSDNELYREALAFNSHWFPDYYIRTALFFKVVKQTEWPDVDPRVVVGFDYSAGGPWQQNVAARLAAIPDLIPPAPGGGAGCGVSSANELPTARFAANDVSLPGGCPACQPGAGAKGASGGGTRMAKLPESCDSCSPTTLA
jgi:hypothetical protein